MTPPLREASRLARRVELHVERRLAGLLHGDHAGLLPGPGSEAGDGRRYEPGDDVRLIDWALSARAGTTHVRDPIADHELTVWLVVDRSPSMVWGTAERTKLDTALHVAATVGLPATSAGNRLAALAPPDRVPVPPGTGRRHLSAVLARLARPEPDGTAADVLAGALGHLGRFARRRGLVVVVSDLLDGGWETPLRRLAVRHDVVVVEVVDPRELELPDVGNLRVVDPETGRTREVPTSSRRLRERYAAAAAEQRRSHVDAVRRAGADHVLVRTDGDPVLATVRGLRARRQRRRSAAGRP